MNTFKAYEGTKIPQLPAGDYLSVDPLDRGETANGSLWDLWDVMNQEVAKISTHPAARQPLMTKDLMETTLIAMDKIMVNISIRIQTRANKTFSRVYGDARNRKYEAYPIRWPGENRQALNIVLALVDSVFAVPQIPSNRIDNGIIDDHAALIARPIFDLKARLMREWFNIEVKGEISVDELQALFRNAKLIPPLRASIFDRRDTATDLSGEDADAKSDETGKTPTEEELLAVTSGQDVFLWRPELGDWTRFGEVLRRLENAGISQVPLEPFPFTTGTITAS